MTTVLLPAADCFAAAFAIAATIKWACDRPKRRHRDSAR